MKVPCDTLRRLKLLREYDIVDFYEDDQSSDALIVYIDWTAQEEDSVEMHAVVFDIELENQAFDPRNFPRLPPEREREEIEKALARRRRDLKAAVFDSAEDAEPLPL